MKMIGRVIGGLSLTVVSLGFSIASAATFTAEKVSFLDITGTVEVKTTSGDEIDIEIRQGLEHMSIQLSEKDGELIVSGEPWRDDEARDCCDQRISRFFDARRGRKLKDGEPVDEAFFADHPTIIISVPVETDLSFDNARMRLSLQRLAGELNLNSCYVYGETAQLDSAIIGLVDGSRLVIGDVAAGLELDISGDADFLAGNVAMADIDIAGPGDVILGDIDGMLDVSIAGSGIVRANRMTGPIAARIAGSGGLGVKDGRADTLKATLDGSGGIYFGGIAKNPDIRIAGSGEVRLREVQGRMTHVGSGDVYVGEDVFSDE